MTLRLGIQKWTAWEWPGDSVNREGKANKKTRLTGGTSNEGSA